jgi:hypothetical protein
VPDTLKALNVGPKLSNVWIAFQRSDKSPFGKSSALNVWRLIAAPRNRLWIVLGLESPRSPGVMARRCGGDQSPPRASLQALHAPTSRPLPERVAGFFFDSMEATVA